MLKNPIYFYYQISLYRCSVLYWNIIQNNVTHDYIENKWGEIMRCDCDSNPGPVDLMPDALALSCPGCMTERCRD